MHPHDYLLAVAITLTQPVISGITAPLGINGFLKRKLGYVFHFSDMEEARTRGMSLPDGLIYNEQNKLLLIPECKSSIQENSTVSRLIKQLQCYSSDEFLKVIHTIIPNFQRSEIVIITYFEVAKEIQLFLKSHQNELKSISNTVIWAVDKIPGTDQISTKLFDGTHIDKELNAALTIGVQCRPPAREFLSSPDIPDSRFTSIIGRRLLGSIVTSSPEEFTIEQFLDENKDLAVSFARLRRIFASLFRIVPNLGSFDRKSNTIKLKTRVDYLVIQSKLREIGKMSSAEFHRRLGEPAEEETSALVKEPEPEKPTKQVSLLDFQK
jgi:hypothetical protein